MPDQNILQGPTLRGNVKDLEWYEFDYYCGKDAAFTPEPDGLEPDGTPSEPHIKLVYFRDASWIGSSLVRIAQVCRLYRLGEADWNPILDGDADFPREIRRIMEYKAQAAKSAISFRGELPVITIRKFVTFVLLPYSGEYMAYKFAFTGGIFIPDPNAIWGNRSVFEATRGLAEVSSRKFVTTMLRGANFPNNTDFQINS